MRKHQAFWSPEPTQVLWSGRSCLRRDKGNELTHDPGRIMVDATGSDWQRFEAFAIPPGCAVRE